MNIKQQQSIRLNGGKKMTFENQENLIVEYGNENLKDILSNYILETFIEILNQK